MPSPMITSLGVAVPDKDNTENLYLTFKVEDCIEVIVMGQSITVPRTALMDAISIISAAAIEEMRVRVLKRT